jgi:hypothetical protein
VINPRDAAPRYNVPVNVDTGQPLTDNQLLHLTSLKEAAEGLYAAMHAAEGTNPPDGPFQDHHFQSRRMAIAATHLETALMFARKAALR